jgi:hypothetical protein
MMEMKLDGSREGLNGNTVKGACKIIGCQLNDPSEMSQIL